jgi:integrase
MLALLHREGWPVGVTVKQWKGAWWLFVNHRGQRKAKRVGVGDTGKKAAKDAATKLAARLALGENPLREADSGVLFEDYAQTWLDRIRHTRKHSTHEDYQIMLTRELLPAFKGMRLGEITRERVKALAMVGLKKGHSPKTVLNYIRGLSSLLSHAVEDGLLAVNPALKPGKFLPGGSKRKAINPYTREEVAHFLEAARVRIPRYYPLFLCAVRTGLREGELLALQWTDLDFSGRFIEVQRNYTRGEITTPKSGESRRVDMSLELRQVLRDFQTERQLEATVKGWPEVPPWVFCNEDGGILDPSNLRERVFYGVLKAVGFRRVRFHDLRHTFASLLLQQGESLVYVKEQMGHSSIAVTVDLYGHLIPGGNKQAVDRLDSPRLYGQNATPAQPATERGTTHPLHATPKSVIG